MAYSEAKSRRPRLLVTVRTDDRPHLGERTKAYLAGGKPQTAEFVAYAGRGRRRAAPDRKMGAGRSSCRWCR
ncbi:putative protein OS=Streptomyces alboniger OX=132473 GN=CP975_12630 PE=4 SV=1 [Streptomyces alboniger]